MQWWQTATNENLDIGLQTRLIVLCVYKKQNSKGLLKEGFSVGILHSIWRVLQFLQYQSYYAVASDHATPGWQKEGVQNFILHDRGFGLNGPRQVQEYI